MPATPPSATTGLADSDLPDEIHKVGAVLHDAANEDHGDDHISHVGATLRDAAAE